MGTERNCKTCRYFNAVVPGTCDKCDGYEFDKWAPIEDAPSRPEETIQKTRYQAAIEALIGKQIEKGRGKYGVTLEDNVTLTAQQRIEHLEEELIDGLMYSEHIKQIFAGNGLTADDYQRAALRTAQVDRLDTDELLLNGVMGLCGEAGECIDLIKKTRFQGHELDRDKIKKELGDVAWYLAVASWAAGFPLSDVFDTNIEKLKARYPDGFDKARSIHRAE